VAEPLADHLDGDSSPKRDRRVRVAEIVESDSRQQGLRDGTLVDTEDLIGAAEVADIVGLAHRNSLTTYLPRYDDFPRPVVDLSRSRVRLWLRQDIERWAKKR
jgi:glutathione-regulated potassium-efflux system ancillary protein KefG